jgi:transposase
MTTKPRVIRLPSADRETLEQWVRSRTAPQQVERARLLLGAADGMSGYQMQETFGVSRPTIQRWLDRYEEAGIAGLADRPRAGRPREVTTTEFEEEVVRITLKEKPPQGTHWSTRLLGAKVGVHHSLIGRIWKAHGLKPHLSRTFKLSNDPKFISKLRDVVGLYVAPPERAIVFSFDEKSQIQALDRTQPGLPLKKGRAGTMTHDYKRHGTTTLFAALDVATGEVMHECMARHRHQEFLRFIRNVVKQTDPDLELHFILDNYATHKHAKVKAWLRRNPRVHFHFVPTSASWLNLVERFFSELTTRQLKRLAVNSVADLQEAITAYIDSRNRQPKPYVWTASVEQIIAKVERGKQTLATLH